MKILIVDDDPQLRALVAMAVERAGYQVITAADGAQALTHAAREAPDLVVLDIGLPGMDGFEICRRLRAQTDSPVLFLTARDDEIDRVLGFELGGDDYVTKPFSPRELVGRIRAILRRSQPAPEGRALNWGSLTLDPAAGLCSVDGAPVALTATEQGLLAQMLARPGALHSRRSLIAAIWGASSPVSDRTLDSHLRNLRAKLAEAGLAEAIVTLHGQGVKLGACT